MRTLVARSWDQLVQQAVIPGSKRQTHGIGSSKGTAIKWGRSAGTARRVREKKWVVFNSAFTVVFNTSDFNAGEFKNRNKDIQKFCRMIKVKAFSSRYQQPKIRLIGSMKCSKRPICWIKRQPSAQSSC
jgi:hypothetical protein